MTYICRHFSIKELVPPETIAYLGEEKSWWLFQPEALLCIDLLRDDLGPCTINNWARGGDFKYSGFRPANCTVGSQYSMHRLGMAFDMKFNGATADRAREHIRQNRERFAWIRGMETGVSWCHIDGRNYDGLLEFKP